LHIMITKLRERGSSSLVRTLSLLLAPAIASCTASHVEEPPPVVAEAPPPQYAEPEPPPGAAPDAPPPSTPPAPPPTTPPSPPAPAASSAPVAAPPGTPLPAEPPPTDAQPVYTPTRPSGQWVYTSAEGWVWMPYARSYTYVTPAEDDAYAYVYYPAHGWLWVRAPWVLGVGPRPYWGRWGPVGFAWYARPWFHPHRVYYYRHPYYRVRRVLPSLMPGRPVASARRSHVCGIARVDLTALGATDTPKV